MASSSPLTFLISRPELGTYVVQLGDSASWLKQEMRHALIRHRQYICANGQDMPEVRDWKWES